MTIENNCRNCLYDHTDAKDAPCNSCGLRFGSCWEPKEEEARAEKASKNIESVYKPENIAFKFGPFCAGCKCCGVEISYPTASATREITCQYYRYCCYAYGVGLVDGIGNKQEEAEK